MIFAHEDLATRARGPKIGSRARGNHDFHGFLSKFSTATCRDSRTRRCEVDATRARGDARLTRLAHEDPMSTVPTRARGPGDSRTRAWRLAHEGWLTAMQTRDGDANARRRCKRGTAMQTRDGDANARRRCKRGTAMQTRDGDANARRRCKRGTAMQTRDGDANTSQPRRQVEDNA